MSVKKLTFLAFFTTVSLAVFAVESALPPLAPIPGIKMGLANLVTLILLEHSAPKDALTVLCARIFLSVFLFGQAMSLLYSIAGGLTSLLVMALCRKLLSGKFSCLTGAMGGLTHNMAQLLTAYALTATPGVFAYLPFLTLSGVLTGLFTGFCAEFLDRHLSRLFPRFPEN